MKKALPMIVALVMASPAIYTQAPDGALAFDKGWTLQGDRTRIVRDGARDVLQVETGFAHRRDIVLQDGTIEFDVRLTARRSFVYVHFRVQDAGEREEFYLRPHKSALPDAVQYAPVWQGSSAWQLHHGPAGTASVTLASDRWTRVRVVVQGRRAALFVDDMTTPALLVPQLSRDTRAGSVSLGGFLPADVPGDGPIATFANVRVRPNDVPFDFDAAITKMPAPPAPPDSIVVVREWAVSPAFVPPDVENPVPSAPGPSALEVIPAEPDGLVQLHRHVKVIPGSRTVAAFATIQVNAPRAGPVAFDLGFSDIATVFVNGSPTFRGDASYSFDRPRREGLIGFDQARLYLPLKAGWNDIAILVSDSFGGWGLMGRFVGAPGLVITAQATPPIWGPLAGGPYGVGFDPVGDSNAIAVWYPASDGGTAMTLADYSSPNELRGHADALKNAGISSGAVDAMFGAAMAARRGAAPLGGRFPLILVGQGNAQGPADQAVLAEYLASHGFVVATTPSPMVRTPMTSESQVGSLAERQARDLQDALTVLAGWSSADVTRVGTVGHSFGARATLLLAMRESRVAAIVSLDGGIGTATGSASFRQAASFDAAKAVAPILHYYERLDAFMAPDFTLLESLPARVTTVPIEGLHHAHFTTLGFASVMIPEMATATGAAANAGKSLQRVAEGTLQFLRTALGQAPRAPGTSGSSEGRPSNPSS